MDTNTDQPWPGDLFDGDDPVFARRRRFGRPGPKSLLAAGARDQRAPARMPQVPPSMDLLDVPQRLPDDPPWAAPLPTDHPLEASLHIGIYDNDGQPIPLEPREEFLRRLSGIRPRIGLTSLYHRGAHLRVSTVFLGCDVHLDDGPPRLWETMLFTGHPDSSAGVPLDGWRWRYTSARAAIVGHGRIVAAIRAGYAALRPPARLRPGSRHGAWRASYPRR